MKFILKCGKCENSGVCEDCLWPPTQKHPTKFIAKEPKVKGVAKDAPKTTNEAGGSQSAVAYGFDCLDPRAMFAMCEALEEGRINYGKDNWRKIPVDDHLNHLLIHVFAFMAGDTQDDHLGHALCRAMFAKAVSLKSTPEEVKDNNA